MKYLLFANESGLTHAVLFDGCLRHDNMADNCKHLGGRKAVVAAGFVKMVDGKLICDGYSESLKVGADPKDAAIIEVWMNI